MHGVMGEYFIDHQCGIATARTRLPAAMPRTGRTEGGMAYPEAGMTYPGYA
jgi:hypothetical protein